MGLGGNHAAGRVNALLAEPSGDAVDTVLLLEKPYAQVALDMMKVMPAARQEAPF